MLSNLKIGIRLSIGFALTLCLLISVALIGISRVGDLQTRNRRPRQGQERQGQTRQRPHRQRQQGVGRFHRNMLITARTTKRRAVEMDQGRRSAQATVDQGFRCARQIQLRRQGQGGHRSHAKEARKPFVTASIKLEEQAKARQWDEAVKQLRRRLPPGLQPLIVKTVSMPSSTIRPSSPRRSVRTPENAGQHRRAR
jgi:hypothetical protein